MQKQTLFELQLEDGKLYTVNELDNCLKYSMHPISFKLAHEARLYQSQIKIE